MIPVKEEFLTEDKTKQAIKKGGCEAVVMWLAIKGYVARKNSGGFVPDEAIDTLPGAPRNPRKALQALIDCGLRDSTGKVGSGLVDPHPFGWMLHDYEDHGTLVEVEQERRDKARAQKAARRAELARQKELRLSATVRGQSADITTDDGADKSPDTPRPRTHPSAPARAAQPSPAQPIPEEEDPPTPAAKPGIRSGSGARCLDAMTIGPPAKRLDVVAVFEAWKRAFGRLPNTAFRDSYDEDAVAIASAIDSHTVEDCLLVARYAPEDDMVSGRIDERKAKHESIRYIFGKEETFSRILRLAHQREGERSSETAAERVARLKKQAGGIKP